MTRRQWRRIYIFRSLRFVLFSTLFSRLYIALITREYIVLSIDILAEVNVIDALMFALHARGEERDFVGNL